MSEFTLPAVLDTAAQRQAAIRTVLDEMWTRFALLKPPPVSFPCLTCNGTGIFTVTRVMSPTMTSSMQKACDKCDNYANRGTNTDCANAIAVDLCHWQWNIEKVFGKSAKTDLLAAAATYVGSEREVVLLGLLMQQMKL